MKLYCDIRAISKLFGWDMYPLGTTPPLPPKHPPKCILRFKKRHRLKKLLAYLKIFYVAICSDWQLPTRVLHMCGWSFAIAPVHVSTAIPDRCRLDHCSLPGMTRVMLILPDSVSTMYVRSSDPYIACLSFYKEDFIRLQGCSTWKSILPNTVYSLKKAQSYQEEKIFSDSMLKFGKIWSLPASQQGKWQMMLDDAGWCRCKISWKRSRLLGNTFQNKNSTILLHYCL